MPATNSALRHNAHFADVASELPPPAFDKRVSTAVVDVTRGYPYGMRAWRPFPATSLPGVSISVPAVIATDPNMLPTWTRRTAFVNANRRSHLYHDLSIRRCYSKAKPKQRGKNTFAHLISCGSMSRWIAVAKRTFVQTNRCRLSH
jgi:hypothetical protein